MNSPAHDIALYLAANGVGAFGGSSGWVISADVEPEKPDTTVTIYTTGGEGADTDEQNIQQPTIQVRVRTKDYTAGYDKQEEIRTLLALASQPLTMTTSKVHFKEAPDIDHIGRDDNDRHLWVANYRTLRTAL